MSKYLEIVSIRLIIASRICIIKTYVSRERKAAIYIYTATYKDQGSVVQFHDSFTQIHIHKKYPNLTKKQTKVSLQPDQLPKLVPLMAT